MDKEYITTSEAKTRYKVSDQTLRRWDKARRVDTIRTDGGWRRYSVESLNEIFGNKVIKPNDQPGRKICYCRVSPDEPLDLLIQQEDYMREQYPYHEIISDVQHGIIWKQRNVVHIIRDVLNSKVDEIVVMHENRLCVIGIEIFKTVIENSSAKFIDLSQHEYISKSREMDIALQIINKAFTSEKIDTTIENNP
jgi:putative resolvase